MNRMSGAYAQVALGKVERESGDEAVGVAPSERRSLAVWMSSSLGFSLKVTMIHSSSYLQRWQQHRSQEG